MARSLHKLSSSTIASARKPGLLSDGGNLYLQVTLGAVREGSEPKLSKSWIFLFTKEGKSRYQGLGSYPSVSLRNAREKAARCRELLAYGKDPIEAHREEKRAAAVAAAKLRTFEQCAEAYVASHEAAWKNDKHRQQWRSTLKTYVYPVLGTLPVATINADLVMEVLEPIWCDKPETASRVRGRIERVLAWAKVKGYRKGENPALWRGNLDQLLPAKTKVRKVVHHAALPYGEVAALMAGLRRRSSNAARALEFLILTATRTSETLGAVWDEINLAESVWIIPAERMKADKEHRVPLPPRAVDILREMEAIRTSDFVFAGAKEGRPLSNMALAMLLRRIGYRHITPHGFRSAFKDWATECTNAPNLVSEAALAHKIPNAVEAAYRRGDLFEKRRKLMHEWTDFACSPLPERRTGSADFTATETAPASV